MATRTISTRIVIEGEAQYRNAIKNCNSELSSLQSALKLVESSYKGNANTQKALAAKVEALSNLLEAQKSKVEKLEGALENAAKAKDEYAKGVDEAEAALAAMADSTEDTAKQQEELKAALAESEAKYEAASRKVNDWQKQLNDAKVKLNDLDVEVKKNEEYLEEAKKSTDSHATSIDRFGKAAKEAGDKTAEFGDKSATAIDGLAAALAATGISKAIGEIKDALVACTLAASDFETATAKISTLVDVSTVDLGAMRTEITELSNRTGISAVQLGEAAYQAISGGVDAAKAVSFVAAATELATGGFTESATAVDVLTTAVNAYGLNTEEATSIADMLITTQNLGKTTVNELAASLGNIIPIASAYGVKMDNLSAAYAELTAGGINTASATTNLKGMFTELADSGSVVSKILKEQTGKSFAELNAQGASLGDVLNILGRSVSGDTTAFSNLWSSTEAGTGALALLNVGAEKFNSTLGAMRSSTGAATSAYEAMANTTEGASKRLSTSFENLKIAVGEQLNPAIEKLSDLGAGALQWATEFIQANQWLVPAIMGVVTALSMLAAGFAIYAVVDRLAASFKNFTAALGGSKIMLAVTAITALVTAVGSLLASLPDPIAKTRELTEACKDSAKAYDELSAEMETEHVNVSKLSTALSSLMSVEKKTPADKKAIFDVVQQLNEAVPELALAYDAEADSLNKSTDELYEYLKAQQTMEKAVEAVKRRIELEQEELELKEQLAEAEKNLSNSRIYYTSMCAVIDEGRTYRAEVEMLTEALGANKDEQLECIGVAEQYTTSMQETATTTADASAEVNEAAQKLKEGITEAMTALIEQYNSAYDSARDSLEKQMGLFEDMSDVGKTSIDDMIKALQSQATYMDEYADNMATAVARGVDIGLVQKLSDGSRESAAQLAALADATDEDIEDINNSLRQVEQGKDDLARISAEMNTDFAASMDEMKAEAREAGILTGEGLVRGIKSMIGSVEEAGDEMGRAVIRSTKNRLQIKSPSKATEEIGKFIIDGLIVGIQKGENKVKLAVEGLSETIKKSLNESVSEFYQGLYDSAYSDIDGEFKLFEKVEKDLEEKSVTITELMENIKSQQDFMDQYTKDLNDAVKAGVDGKLLSQLADGTQESAKNLAAILQGTPEQIAALNKAMEELDGGKAEMATVAAEIAGSLKENMDELEKIAYEAVQDAVEAMNQASDAEKSGKATVEGYILGAESMRTTLENRFREIAQAARAAYDEEAQLATMVQESGATTAIAIKNAVPSHLTGQLSNAANSSVSNTVNSSYSVVINSPQALSPSEIARETKNAVKRMAWV